MKKNSSSRFAGARALIVIALIPAAGCLSASGTLPASVPEPAAKVSKRTLTFAERVAYQYAIEEVYWHHRIWPKENARPKPSLDDVVSAAQMQNKVEDYLRDSQFLQDVWHRPITREQLQVEMDRMASHTKEPDVLRELFAALDNDPFIIAECLTRPIIAERLANELNVRTNIKDASLSRRLPSADDAARSAIAPYQTAYKLPEISPVDCADNTWTPTTTANAPEARDGEAAVWTGSEMITWGGENIAGVQLNTGAKYNPATDTWTATSTTNAPSARYHHAAVWTGSEMIIWGGYGSGFLNTGGRYNPMTDTWTPTSTANAPTQRIHPSAVWTGSEMIVWGGYNFSSGRFNSGGRYNPATDTWIATNTINAPSARWDHTALWSGRDMIIWGGTDQSSTYLNTGGRYDPDTDSWRTTSLLNVPLGRLGHAGVWNGSEMIVWGGVHQTSSFIDTGGKYNPTTDSWVGMSTANAPSARAGHTGVWTGSEMIVWGGEDSVGRLNTGARYNPSLDIWGPTSNTNAPSGRWNQMAVWTGNQMIIWGGDIGPQFLNSGARYCAQPFTPLVQRVVSRKGHGNAGTFDLDLPFSGTPGIESRNGGVSNDYTVIVTFLANVTINASPQAAVTSGIGTIGSGGVSDGGTVTIAGNVVTIPLTNVANAQAINVTLNNVNGSTNVTIPMRVLIGDVNGNGAVNASDVGLTKSGVGLRVDATNFKADVNTDGSINSTDVSLVKSLVGTGLPQR